MNALITTKKGSSNPRRCRLSSGGFSLLELMVVIGVMAAAAAVAMPTYQAHRFKSELRRAVFQICSDIYEARAQAIRTRQICNVTFADTPLPPTPQSYTLNTPNNAGVPTNLSDFGGRVQFAANPDATTDTFSTLIAFQANGTLTTVGPRQIYIESIANGALIPIVHLNRYRVQVTPTGAVSVMRWDTQNSIWVD